MSHQPTAVITAPYWGQPGHLGCVRIERFLRWLSADGFDVTLVRAGSGDGVRTRSWGSEVTVRDPIGFYRDLPAGSHEAIPLRRANRMRRWLAYALLVPDPLVAWAKRAARHPLVVERSEGADWIVSSSPPESAHVAAYELASHADTRLLVDLRDGWLDEPTIPLLHASRLQQARHGRLERRILQRADNITVTSGLWQKLLAERLPWAADRVTVLTNAYPALAVGGQPSEPPKDGSKRALTLLYAGKLYSSRSERRTAHLFEPLERGVGDSSINGRMVFVGNLTAEERRDLDRWGQRLAEGGWVVETRPPVGKEQILELIAAADGLLLLSSSMASIPAKLFDYLPSGRPILAVARTGSAVWEIGLRLPQMSVVDYDDPSSFEEVGRYLQQCGQREPAGSLPGEFSEDHVREEFLKVLRKADNGGR